IAAHCRQLDVPLFALVVPSAVDLCPRLEIHVDPAQYPTWSPARLTDALAALLTERGVPFVDLAPVFREAGAEALFRLPHDFHWSAAGQALAAQHAARFLRAHKLWPPVKVR